MTEQKRHGFVGWFFGPYAEYVRRIRPLFVLCSLLFILSLGMGYLLGNTFPGSALESLLGTFPDVSQMSLFDLFVFVVANNASKSLLFMILGLLGGIPPLLFVVLNGFFVGWVAWSLSSTSGLAYVVAGLTPHGIIEIPTILLSMAMGMSLGYTLLNKIRGRSGFSTEAKYAILLFINRIIPLLILAAVVEVTVTPLFLLLLGFA